MIIGGGVTITIGLIPPVILIIAVTILAFPAIDAHTSITNKHDASEIIIDEVIGQWLVLLAIPIIASWNMHYSTLITAFVLFRIFDILNCRLFPPQFTFAAGVCNDIMQVFLPEW